MDNTLKRAAAELKEAGCRVFAWHDDTYNRSWSKGDYTMLYYAFPDSPNIGYLSRGEYGMSVAYSRAYIPSRGSGSGVLYQGGGYVRPCDGVRCVERAVT